MKDLAIYCSGGYGREIACLIKEINDVEPQWNLIGFFDDTKAIGTPISHFGKVLGGINVLNNYPKRLAVIIANGDPHALKMIRGNIINELVYFPNIIAPKFHFADSETFSIGEGNIIGHGCSISCDVSIGSYNILNSDVVMGHDVKVGNYNVFMPDIRISGMTTLGDENLVGVGSIIIQRIKVGNQVVIGAGSVLMTNPKDGGTYIGNPAKLIFKLNV